AASYLQRWLIVQFDAESGGMSAATAGDPVPWTGHSAPYLPGCTRRNRLRPDRCQFTGEPWRARPVDQIGQVPHGPRRSQVDVVRQWFPRRSLTVEQSPVAVHRCQQPSWAGYASRPGQQTVLFVGSLLIGLSAMAGMDP